MQELGELITIKCQIYPERPVSDNSYSTYKQTIERSPTWLFNRRSPLPSPPPLLRPTHLDIGRRRVALRAVHEDLVQQRHQEGGRLAGARLGTGHQVARLENDGERVLLHRRRRGVLGQLDVLDDDRRQLELLERVDALGHVVTRGVHRDVVVFVEVDAGTGLWGGGGGEKGGSVSERVEVAVLRGNTM